MSVSIQGHECEFKHYDEAAFCDAQSILASALEASKFLSSNTIRTPLYHDALLRSSRVSSDPPLQLTASPAQ